MINKLLKFEQFIFENNEHDLSKHEKYKLLQNSKPVIVYRGISPSGHNFYKGQKDLRFTYYSLTQEKASQYGKIHKYIFNFESLKIKIFKGHDLFEKFGLNANVEDDNVIDTLTKEGYSCVLIKGDELVVFDKKLVKEYGKQ